MKINYQSILKTLKYLYFIHYYFGEIFNQNKGTNSFSKQTAHLFANFLQYGYN